MIHGAAYGPGIYLALDSVTSLGYAWAKHPTSSALVSSPTTQVKRQKTGNRFVEQGDAVLMLAICEVINHTSIQRHARTMVAPQEETVCTRFFLVCNDQQKRNVAMDDLEPEIRKCMAKLNIGGESIDSVVA